MAGPATLSAVVSFTTWSEVTLPLTTWYSRIFLTASGSLSRPSTVPAGSLAKASSVGANTVYGPAPLRVSTSPAAVAAVSRVLNEPAAVAVSTMSFIAAADAIGAWDAAMDSAGAIDSAAMDSAGAAVAAAGVAVAAGAAGAFVAVAADEQADTATAAPINARIRVLRMRGANLGFGRTPARQLPAASKRSASSSGRPARWMGPGRRAR